MITSIISTGALLVAFLNLFLGYLVLKNDRHNLINKVFASLTFVFATWSISLFFYEFPIFFSSIFWIKITFFMVILYTILVLFFSFIFPIKVFKKAWKYAFFVSTIFFIFSLWLLYFTKLWVVDVVVDPVNGLQTILGPAYPWWVTAIWFIVCWAVVNFYLKSRHLLSIQKLQISYFWIGFTLFGIFVCIPDVIIPLLWNDTRYFLIGAVTNLFFSGTIAYTIVKHRLMDIRLVVARSVAYSLLVLTLGIFYASSLFIINHFISQEQIASINIFTLTVLALIIAFSFQPLLRFFEKITVKVFYKDKYDEGKLLYELTLIMASTLRLPDLTRKLLHKITTTIHINHGMIVLLDKKEIHKLTQEGYSTAALHTIEKDIKLIKHEKIAIFDELLESPLKDLMRRFDAAVIIPLRKKGENLGSLILGNKLSGDPYTDQDLHVLEIFAPEATVAIENASTVERVFELEEAKSEFITVVSHQLRTPLSVARWNFEILFEGLYGKIPEKADVLLRRIYEALLDLNRGLNNLIIAVEVEEGKLILKYEEVDFRRDIFEPVKTTLERGIKNKNITVKEDITIGHSLHLDKSKIKKVMETLLENAIRYSPAGSTVSIKVKTEKRFGKNQCLVSVDDQGIGIIPQNQDLIFSRFFRGDEAKKISPNGLGLSLSIAKSFVESHGCKLWLGKKKGPGAIFYFTLPAT